MLRINSELLIDEPIISDPDAPLPVHQHVDALDAYALKLLSTGELSLESAAFAQLFAKRHDAGYGTDISLMQTQFAADILAPVLGAVGSEVDPQCVTEYLQRNADNYMAARIIGHGVLSLVENVRYLEQERGLPRQKALGIASILSAHHPGYPITMVAGFLKDGDAVVPDEMRAALFIDNGGEDPELIRRRLAEFGASELGISSADALYAAVLGYSLDRLSAGSVPDDIEYDRANDEVKLHGGEIFQKKFGLVAGDLDRREGESGERSLIIELFNTAYRRFENEAEAAITAAEAANAPGIQQFVTTQRALIQADIETVQKGVRGVMNGVGFYGKFSELRVERESLAMHAHMHSLDQRNSRNDNILYTLAVYDAVMRNIKENDS